MESKKQRTRWAFGLGVLAVAGLMAACGASGDDNDDDTFATTAASVEDSAGNESGQRDVVTSATAAASASTGGGVASALKGEAAPPATGGGAPLATGVLDRKIIFNASLSLGVPDLDAAFNAVTAVAKTYGGFIERSSFQGGGSAEDNLKRSASVTLRVPVETYNDALQSLRTLPGAKVQVETAKSTEVTEQYTDLQSRLRNLERTETQYLQLLGQAKTVQEILTMTDRLDAVRAQIEQVQGRVKVLDHLTSLASIDVTLAPLAAAAKVEKVESGGPKGFGEAFTDAWDWSLETAQYVGVGVASLAAVGVWLVVPLALVAGAFRFAGRRNTPNAS